MNSSLDNVRRRLIGAAVALVGVGTLGCASTLPSADAPAAESDRAYPAAVVDRAPRLVECADLPGPTPNQISGISWETVRLRFVVTESGAVDPDGMVVIGRGMRRTRNASSAAGHEATQLALTCRYEPGLLDDEPVRVLTERTFRVHVAG